MPEIGNNTINSVIDLVDETFDVSLSNTYHLSIQIEAGRMTFCVFNTVINKYILLCSYSSFITDLSPDSSQSLLVNAFSPIFEEDNKLSLNYKSCSVLWISPRCTLVPDSLFNPDEAELYLNFNHGIVKGEHTLYRHIRPANLCSVFSCPEDLLNLIWTYQPRTHFFHQSSPFIESIIAGTHPSEKMDVAIYYYPGWCDVVVVKNNKLLFYNSFKINAPADSVYYFVGVANMFDIDPKSIKIIYTGNLQQLPPEIAILKGFSGSIIECEPYNTVSFSHCIAEPFRKNFINLFNLYRCE